MFLIAYILKPTFTHSSYESNGMCNIFNYLIYNLHNWYEYILCVGWRSEGRSHELHETYTLAEQNVQPKLQT